MTATAGVQYLYFYDASYACIPFITPCGQVDGIQLPPNAGIEPIRGAVFWTPSASQSNTTVPFQIATKPDPCGNRATQSWTVTVSPAPVIQSFAASNSAVAPGANVTLTAVFQGDGHIEGIGSISSGVPLSTPPLNVSSAFQLTVSNTAGAVAKSVVQVDVLGPPVVQSFAASPLRVGQGGSSRLSWTTSGNFSSAVLAPLGTNVVGAFSIVVSPVSTTTYVLQLSNALGASANASVQVEVVPSASIQSFSVSSSSATKGASVSVSATFDGASASIEREVAGVYSVFAPITSGGTVSSGPLFRTTGFRLSVANALGSVTTRDLTVTLVGPGTFQPAAGTPRVPNRFYHSAIRLADGRVFISGGRDGSTDRSTELFDPATESFSPGPNLLWNRVRHSAALLPDGRVLLAGGALWPATSQPAELYDPATNSMSPLTSAVLTTGSTLAFADGRVLVQGFIASSPPGPSEAGVVVFDSSTGTFGVYIPFAGFSRPVSPVRLANGSALFASGHGASELFSPTSNSFALTGRVNNPHGVDFLTVPLLDGRAVLIGGTVSPATPPEFYHPSTGQYSIGSRVFARRYGRAVALADGKVLVAGGDISEPHPWAEVYDPSSDSMTATGGLGAARALHAVTVLQDGRVLVVGGCSSVPCTAEIYTPD